MPKTKQAKNERNTENVIRDSLQENGYYDQRSDIQIDEQKSNIASIKKALKNASKTGKSGVGAPEFIISSPTNPDFLLVIEGKADIKDHESGQLEELLIHKIDITKISDTEQSEAIKRANRFAVDGVLHYARFLAKEHNVIAIGVSGETAKSIKLSTYLWTKGVDFPKLLTAKDGASLDKIISWQDYLDAASFDPSVQRAKFDELMSFAHDLHIFMRDHAKLTESEKPLLVSGTLIALQSPAFSLAFGAYKPKELQDEWFKVIQSEIQKAEIPKAKKDNMAQPYSGIAVHPELGKPTKEYPKGILHELIQRLNERVKPFLTTYRDFDVVGQFYGEFLKYTGGDKKALGIVLTPRHITELFSLLANVNEQSIVLDICTGTGGFLISAMHQMMKSATTDAERLRIKQFGLIGVEQQPNMFALAASNMILRGDGKANLYQGSCFDDAITKAVKEHKADVGMINPPYSQGTADLHELRFIQHMLDCLKEGGTGLAIVPMSCAISSHPMKAELMAKHTLEAVMSMPGELFYPVGVVACIMVWTAKKPHAKSRKKTWFGYWKEDGFTKTKHRGRLDIGNYWQDIRNHWVTMFLNRDEHVGESVKQEVGATDEWCAEAYMETDYGLILQADFEKTIRDHAVFRLLGIKNAPSFAEDDL